MREPKEARMRREDGLEEIAVEPRRRRKERHPATGKPSKVTALGKVPLAMDDAERAQVLDTVLERMAEGQTLAETARALMVPESTVRKWFRDDPERWETYRATKKVLGDALAERALTVAMAADSKTFQADRLKVETLRWLASKVNAEEYGDRSVQETTGEVTLKIVVEEERVEPRQALTAMASTMRVGATAAPALPPAVPVEDAVVEEISAL